MFLCLKDEVCHHLYAPRPQLNTVVYLSPQCIKSSQTEPVTLPLEADLYSKVLSSRVYLKKVDLYGELL